MDSYSSNLKPTAFFSSKIGKCAGPAELLTVADDELAQLLSLSNHETAD